MASVVAVGSPSDLEGMSASMTRHLQSDDRIVCEQRSRCVKSRLKVFERMTARASRKAEPQPF